MSADSSIAEAASLLAPGEDESTPATPPDRPVAVGENWRGLYQVAGVFAERAGRWYQARRLSSGEAVHLRVSALAVAPARAALFARLRALDCAQLQRPLEEHTTEWERVEVWQPDGAVPLRAWRAARSAITTALVAAVVRDLSAALVALHDAGLGHFNLNPNVVTVDTDGAGPKFVVGSFDTLTAVKQDGLVLIDADPLYAPPETAGLAKHPAGESLFAWDWWSLGRVLQELLLGEHILHHLPDATIAALPQGLRGQAEALLFERATGSLRAGGVELMPNLDPRHTRLLRGLLTSACDARWGAAEVREWLAGEMPAEHYHAPRQARFFRLGGRAHTVSDAAEILRGPAHWTGAERQLAPDEAGTLARFLASSPDHRDELDSFKAAAELAGSKALSDVPAPVRRALAAALALHALAQRPFRWRGGLLDAAHIRAELARPGALDAARAELSALAEPVIVLQIRRHDKAGASLLERSVKFIAEAEKLFAQKLALPPAKVGDPALLWQIGLEGEAAWSAAVLAFRAKYTLTSHAALEAIFTTPHPTPAMLLVLARVAADPARFGFVSAEELRRRRLARLAEERVALGRIIFWRRLEAAMRAGPVVFGRGWIAVLAGSGALGLLAVHVPGPSGAALGLGPVLLAVALRLAANRLQADVVARLMPELPRWRWHDAARRCAVEAAALGRTSNKSVHLPTALAEHVRVTAEIRSISVAADKVRPEAPHRPFATWAITGLGWILALALLVGSVVQGVRHPPSWTAHVVAWQKSLALKAAVETEQRVLRISWPFKPLLSEEPFTLGVQGDFEPTAEQLRYARERADQLIAPYEPKTIDATIVIFVPLGDKAGGALFFDGKKNTFIGTKGVLIPSAPLARSWVQIGDKRVVYIGP